MTASGVARRVPKPNQRTGVLRSMTRMTHKATGVCHVNEAKHVMVHRLVIYRIYKCHYVIMYIYGINMACFVGL